MTDYNIGFRWPQRIKLKRSTRGRFRHDRI
jgi:hypothetical protein